MAPRLARFDLHEWHNDNDPAARFVVGASGMPRADLKPYLPRSAKDWDRLWSTPPSSLLDDVKQQLRKAYGFDPDEVLVTQGASEADFLAAYGLAGPGAHVVVEEPAYFALVEPARSLGCRVTRVRRDPRNGFALDAAEVETAIAKGTRLVLLARPNNPAGERMPDTDLRRVAEAAARVGAHVLVDEVFAEATPEGDAPARRLHENILSVNSLTKCLGFGPLHVGWIAGPRATIDQLRRAKAHVRPLNPSLNLALAARILSKRRPILARTRARRRANAATLQKFLAARPELAWSRNRHGTTTVLRLPVDGADDVRFARDLLRREGILVSPGSFVELPGWIRIGLLTDPTALRAGLDGLGRALDGAQARPGPTYPKRAPARALSVPRR